MNDIDNFDKLLRTVGITSREGLLERFAQTIEDGDIEAHWDVLAHGAFKVVVDLNDRFVLKFVSEGNDTEAELSVFSMAAKEGVAEIFVTELGFPLSTTSITLPQVDGEYCNYIIIQEKVLAKWADNETDFIEIPNLDEQEYIENPLRYTTSEAIPFDMVQYCGLEVQEWIQDLIYWYGDNFFNTLLDFLESYQICDVHYGNVGYTIEGRPIIFDWFSH